MKYLTAFHILKAYFQVMMITLSPESP